MIKDILLDLGLTHAEAEAYLVLLKEGPITAGKLAKKLGVPRSSLYGFLKRLHDKGLVFQSMKWGVKTFSAEEPEKINFLFDQQIENLKNKRVVYQSLLPELKKREPHKILAPKFQLFEGNEGVKHVLKDMFLYSNIETQAFWPIKTMIDVLSPDFFRYHNKERIKSNLSTRAIWPQSKAVSIKTYPYLGVGPEFKREIRIAPKEIDFSMGYWIYGTKVAFISSRRESFGFIIESAELVEMLLAQFEVIWRLSKPIVVKPEDIKAFVEEMKLIT